MERHPYADYHTHTVYSHGKGTILENALAAEKVGVKEIAITDHGFNHRIFPVKRKLLDKMKEEIKQAEAATGVKVLLGVEANLIGREGTIDVLPEDYEKLDIVLCGFHKIVKGKNLKEELFFGYKNMFCSVLGTSRKQKEKNTRAYELAVQKNDIDIITHLNYIAKVDCGRVAKACEQTNTYIELNGKRCCYTDEDMQAMLQTNVQFVINSDAHTVDRMGECELGYKMIEKYHIPEYRVANLQMPITPKKEKKLPGQIRT